MKVVWNKKTKMFQFFYAFGYRLTQGIYKIWKFQEIVNKQEKKKFYVFKVKNSCENSWNGKNPKVSQLINYFSRYHVNQLQKRNFWEIAFKDIHSRILDEKLLTLRKKFIQQNVFCCLDKTFCLSKKIWLIYQNVFLAQQKNFVS